MRRRVRLEVEGVELARPAKQIDHDASSSAAARRAGRTCMDRIVLEKVRQAQRQGAQAAYLQHVASGVPVARALCRTDEAKHENEHKTRLDYPQDESAGGATPTNQEPYAGRLLVPPWWTP